MGSPESPVVGLERCQQASTVQKTNDRKMQMYHVSIGRIMLTLGLLVFISTVGSGKATNNNVFGGCMNYYYEVNETCLRCPDNCTICFSDTNCTLCRKGFYGPVCENKCDFNCTGTCHKEYGHCTNGCPDGTYPADDNSCQPCSSMCSLCASNSHCIDCKRSHFLDNGQFLTSYFMCCTPVIPFVERQLKGVLCSGFSIFCLEGSDITQNLTKLLGRISINFILGMSLDSKERTRSATVLVVVTIAVIAVIVSFIVIAVIFVTKKKTSDETKLSTIEYDPMEFTNSLSTKDEDVSSVMAECIDGKDEIFSKSTSEHDAISDLDPDAEIVLRSEGDISLNLENMSVYFKH